MNAWTAWWNLKKQTFKLKELTTGNDLFKTISLEMLNKMLLWKIVMIYSWSPEVKSFTNKLSLSDMPRKSDQVNCLII